MAVSYMAEPYSHDSILSSFHPIVKAWFESRFKEFAPPQRFSILNIRNRINTLISSPTGSGKTLSAFLSILNELVDLSEKGALEDKVYAVYISPLKALANDIKRNLTDPLSEMEAQAKRKLGIRLAIRTGDTTASEKAAMLKHPPHILITTPESFAILLSTIKFREKLLSTQWVVIDEIHALASSKRGSHLSLSLERLQSQTYFTRIGLSATVAPLEEVARFLVGYDVEKDDWRDCKIVDVNYAKQLDLKVLSPVENMMKATYAELNEATYRIIDQLVQSHKTTLIFTNTRSATERVVHHLKDRFPQNYTRIEEIETKEEKEMEAAYEGVDQAFVKDGAKTAYEKAASAGKTTMRSLIGAHHGSLSKEHRLNVEEMLKRGELRAVVSSTSLELGIDIGYIDLVILLGSPKSVARALQRIGRSGHQLHEKAVGRIIVLDRDDLVECSVLLKTALERKIDRISIPTNCADVLAQQILGMALEEAPKHIDDIRSIVRGSYTFHALEPGKLLEIVKYLSGEYANLEERHVYAKIWYEPDTGMIGKKGKLTRVIYMTNIGTIPDETNIKVKIQDHLVGYIAEPFLEKLRRGDVFVLGGNTYEFQFTRGMTAYVKASVNRPPTVPSWYSEMLPLSYDLALEIQRFRRLLEEQFRYNTQKEDILEFINSYLYVDEYGANSVYEYFSEQYRYAEIPHDKKILIEHFSDGQKKRVIFHTLYGRRVNDVLSRAVAFAISKMHKKDVEMGISDNGFYLAFDKSIQATKAFGAIKSEDLPKVMRYALDKTEVLRRRFRHCAARALMILRNYKGNRKSVGKQQMSSRLLMSAVQRISPDFPILEEARREVLEDLMDITHAREVLEQIENGQVQVKEAFTDIPSPFAFNLMVMGYSDIMKMEDKLEFLRRMHNMVLAKIEMKERHKN
ncbi:DEAD/DEAH box helicase [Candidatus Woesearchaeota archaeon]|nr:DEAD/DEAH box helicase [Candidatus Woesearchaeota archaeon]